MAGDRSELCETISTLVGGAGRLARTCVAGVGAVLGGISINEYSLKKNSKISSFGDGNVRYGIID